MQDFGLRSHPLGDSADSQRLVPVLGTVSEGEIEDGAHPFVGGIAPGESATCWRVWEQYRTELYRCCLRWMGGDPHEAKEALSSVALKVLHTLPCHMTGITNSKAWLLRLTYNLCMDMRRGRRRYTNNVTRLEDCAEIHSDTVARGIDQPEQVCLRQELGGHLQRAIAHLPLRLREPLLLRTVEGLSYQEIASRLTLTPANVRKRVQQARICVRTELYAYLSADNGHLKFTN